MPINLFGAIINGHLKHVLVNPVPVVRPSLVDFKLFSVTSVKMYNLCDFKHSCFLIVRLWAIVIIFFNIFN